MKTYQEQYEEMVVAYNNALRKYQINTGEKATAAKLECEMYFAAITEMENKLWMD